MYLHCDNKLNSKLSGDFDLQGEQLQAKRHFEV